jgi:hypothetical protein
MEKFMLIFHGGMDRSTTSPEVLQKQMGKWMAWIEKLNKEGRYLAGEPLVPGGKLLTGKNKVTDGPYTEGKEVVGGFFLIQAKDYDEAVKICEDYPSFETGGTVQVRQVAKIEM